MKFTTVAQIVSHPDPLPGLAAADPDLGHLKRLLLNDEHRELSTLRADLLRLERNLGSEDHRQLSALRADLARLEGWVGSEDRFAEAVASSLVAALKLAEVESHRDLAAAMAPLVVSGIRREIEHSSDTMVETLYPITGRMVTAAVAAMFRELSEDINRKLEETLSPTMIRLRIRAMITRRPLSALILAEAGRGRLQRLLLIERATGAILAVTDSEGSCEAEPANTLHLLGGLVSAIVEFADHALSDVHGALRHLDFGGQVVFLRASPRFIMAAVTAKGGLAPGLPAFIDEAFLELLDRLHAAAQAPAPALAQLHGTIAEQMRPVLRRKSRVSPLAVIGGLLAVGLGAWAVHSWSLARERSRQETALAAVEQMPDLQNYPVRLAFDRDAHVIRASGLVTTPAVADALARELARRFPAWPVRPRLAILSDTLPDAAIQARLAELASKQRRLEDEAARRADRDLALLRGEVAAIDTPLRRLAEVVRGTAVFFEVNGDSYHDPEGAKRALSALAEALKPTTARLRVIGFADGSGTPQANLTAARSRAERVSADLQALGVDPSRLTTVSTRPVLSIDDQPRSGANRRVEFELAYPSE